MGEIYDQGNKDYTPRAPYLPATPGHWCLAVALPTPPAGNVNLIVNGLGRTIRVKWMHLSVQVAGAVGSTAQLTFGGVAPFAVVTGYGQTSESSPSALNLNFAGGGQPCGAAGEPLVLVNDGTAAQVTVCIGVEVF